MAARYSFSFLRMRPDTLWKHKPNKSLHQSLRGGPYVGEPINHSAWVLSLAKRELKRRRQEELWHHRLPPLLSGCTPCSRCPSTPLLRRPSRRGPASPCPDLPHPLPPPPPLPAPSTSRAGGYPFARSASSPAPAPSKRGSHTSVWGMRSHLAEKEMRKP